MFFSLPGMSKKSKVEDAVVPNSICDVLDVNKRTPDVSTGTTNVQHSDDLPALSDGSTAPKRRQSIVHFLKAEK